MNRLTAAALVIVATAVLVWAVRPPASPPALIAGTAAHIVTVSLDSTRAGDRSVTVAVTDRAGHPALVAGVGVTAVLTSLGHAAPTLVGVPAGPGSFRASGVPLMTPGDWLLAITLNGEPSPDPIDIPVTVTA
jgi:hypothetical protein